MQQLRLVRTTPEALVVSPVDHGVSDGPTPQFALPVDDRLRTAVARTRGRTETGGGEQAPRRPVSPREIQARLRCGAEVEELAGSTGVPLEKVRRYAGPVLAERYHVVQTVRSTHAPGASPSDRRTLGEVVDERLSHEADEGSTTWDAWLQTDGTWAVHLRWTRDGRPLLARWAWHAARRALRPRDDLAQDVATPVSSSDPLALPASARAVERDEPAPAEQVPVPATALSRPGTAEPRTDADDEQAPDGAAPDEAPGREELDLPPVRGSRPQARPRPAAARRGGRASVPSWDDIVFGAHSS